jgi:quinol monooxygenase YgiN
MIVVQGDFVIKAGKRDEAIAAMVAVQQAVERDEAGCIRYAFYADLEDPNKFIVYEEWETKAHLAAHGSQENPPPHMVTFRQAMADLRESAEVHFMNAELTQV